MSDPYGPPPPEQPEGQSPGQQPSGEPVSEQPPSGQPSYGEPAPQPSYGQPPYGQPPEQQYPHGQQPYAQQPYAQQPGPGGLTPDERTWGGAAHWSALVASLVALSFLGPLLVMLIKGNESPWIRRQAVESLNFQLSILIYGIVAAITLIILIGFLLLPAVGIFWLVFTIIGSVKAGNGEDYRYPLTIRMVS
jgi:uncharacterized Tic20 family protein